MRGRIITYFTKQAIRLRAVHDVDLDSAHEFLRILHPEEEPVEVLAAI